MSGDDAIEQWQRELDSAPPALVPSRWSPRVALELRLVLPAILGAGVATLILLLNGWPPPLDPVSPAFLAIPLVAIAAALVTRRGSGEMVLWATAACLCGALAVAVIVPVWALLEVFECWMSWFSDC